MHGCQPPAGRRAPPPAAPSLGRSRAASLDPCAIDPAVALPAPLADPRTATLLLNKQTPAPHPPPTIRHPIHSKHNIKGAILALGGMNHLARPLPVPVCRQIETQTVGGPGGGKGGARDSAEARGSDGGAWAQGLWVPADRHSTQGHRASGPSLVLTAGGKSSGEAEPRISAKLAANRHWEDRARAEGGRARLWPLSRPDPQGGTREEPAGWKVNGACARS